jgi:hypothetical protein
MHGNVTNVLANVDQTQLILPHLPHDCVIISLFLKRHFEYKSFYMSTNVHLNMVMVASWDLIKTSLYKDLNVTIHHQWASLFTLHMNSEFQIPTYNNASSNNFDFDNEKIHCTLLNSMIYNF